LTSVFGVYSAFQHGFKDYKAAPAWPKPAVSGPVFAPFFNGVASESACVTYGATVDIAYYAIGRMNGTTRVFKTRLP
jgi:hypothetical protein